MTSLRFNVVEKAFQAKPQPVAVPDGRPSEYFGKYVFNREKSGTVVADAFVKQFGSLFE